MDGLIDNYGIPFEWMEETQLDTIYVDNNKMFIKLYSIIPLYEGCSHELKMYLKDV